MKIKKFLKYRMLGMKWKIIISCVIVIFFALIAQFFIFSREYSKIIYNQVKEINLNMLTSIQEEFYTINKSVENSLITIYSQKEFIRNLAYQSDENLLNDEYRQLAYDLAHNSFELNQNVVALYIYDNTNNLISYYRHAQTPTYSYPENIYSDIEVEKKIQIIDYIESSNKTMFITSTYNKNRDLNLVRYVLKIYDADQVIGYIVCDTDSLPFFKLLEKYRYSKSQLIWVQPIADNPIVKSGSQNENYKEEYKKVYDIINSEYNYINNELVGLNAEKDLLKSFELFKVDELKYNFVVWSLVPKDVLETNQNILFRNMLMVLIALFLFISFLFLLISESLTKPLTYIISVIEKIKDGETKLRLKISNNDEIGALSNEFNKMLDEIEVLNEKEYNSRVLINESKYKALQAQINPHFLYNTLETMSGVAKSQNGDIVSTLCLALSNMFRYNLHMENTYATIEQEILHVKNYVYVMNIRMNGIITLTYDIESSSRNINIPKLTLQPLIENSILHGFKHKVDEINIKIGVKSHENHYEIWVEDNGEGIDEIEINKNLESSILNSLNNKESIGLDNINARLQLVFGEQYVLRVNNKHDGGTKVTLTVPL